MSRYINADAIDYKHHKQHKNGKFNTDLLGDAKTLEDAFYQGVMYIHNCIEETPTADVVERKYAEWIGIGYDLDGDLQFKCSNCQCSQMWRTKYCPNCGADMRSKENE